MWSPGEAQVRPLSSLETFPSSTCNLRREASSRRMMASIAAVGSYYGCFPAKSTVVKPSKLPPRLLSVVCRSPEDSSRSCEGSGSLERSALIDRRRIIMSSVGLTAIFSSQKDEAAMASQFADMPALQGKDYGKTKMHYPDYVETNSGLQYKDLRVGTGRTPRIGETVVVDWDGYTIGYYGRIFEARNKTKGGSFVGDDKEFYKFRLGSNEVIPAFEEALPGMALGGVRRIIVPPELGYPENDYNKKGPRPTTFSGQRALDFVLRNQGLIDKTLLFDIELVKILPNGSG